MSSPAVILLPPPAVILLPPPAVILLPPLRCNPSAATALLQARGVDVNEIDLSGKQRAGKTALWCCEKCQPREIGLALRKYLISCGAVR